MKHPKYLLAGLCSLIFLGLPTGAPAQQDDAQKLFVQIREAGDSVDPKLLCRLASLRNAASLVAMEELLGTIQERKLRPTLIAEFKHYAGAGELETRAMDLLEGLLASRTSTDRFYAARAFQNFGDAGQQRLIQRLEDQTGQTVAMRRELVRALANFKPLRAYDLLAAIAQNERDDQLRYAAIQAIAKDRRSIPILKRAVDDPYVMIPAAALDGLRELEVPEAHALALKVARQNQVPMYSTALAVIRILAAKPSLESATVLLDLGRRLESTPRSEALKVLHAMEVPGLDALLAQSLENSRQSVAELLFTLAAIGPRRSEPIFKAVRKLLRSKEADILCAAIRAVGAMRDAGAVKQLKRFTRSSDPEMRAAAIASMSRIETEDPNWRRTLVQMLRNSQPGTRAAAADALGDMKHQGAVPGLLKLLKDRTWQVQVAAIQALAKLRDARAVPPLIELLERTEGRLRKDIAVALRRLTGMPFRRHLPDWQRWWKDQGPDYQLPPLEEVLAMEARIEKSREERIKAGRETVSGFYGIEVLSQRVTFVIDHSGSMSAEVGTASSGGSKTTRLDMAKSELVGVLTTMDEKTRINVISFGSNIHPWEDAIRKANDEAKRDVRTYLKRLVPTGGTNIHDALQSAFEDGDVDTIYFLSDGSPTAGAVTDPVGIREAVRRWNQTRKIVIHTIAIGSNQDLLKWLSGDSGGTHVYRR